MAAPMLALLDEVCRRAGVQVRRAPQGERFVVVRDGTFGGRIWRTGDVVVCEELAVAPGRLSAAIPVVLVPRGHGRPRVGTALGRDVQGDAGEPCSAERFRIAGRIATVLASGPDLVAACVRFAAAEQVLARLPWSRLEQEVDCGSAREFPGAAGEGSAGSVLSAERSGSRDRHTSRAAPQLSLFARAA